MGQTWDTKMFQNFPHYISFAGQIKIILLDLHNNRISVIDADAFRDLDELRSLTLSKNLLTVLPPFADVADTITSLHLKDNNIESLTNIPTLPNLQYFYATPHFHTLPAGIFDGFRALNMVWMMGGSLGEIDDLFLNGSSTVTKLLFRSNHITKLPDLSLHTNLQEADFVNNLIPFITYGEFVSVSSPLIVRLEGNPLWGDRDSCLVALSTGQAWSITGTCEDEVLFDCKYWMYVIVHCAQGAWLLIIRQIHVEIVYKLNCSHMENHKLVLKIHVHQHGFNIEIS